MEKQTAVEWLEERLAVSFGEEMKSLRGFFVIAKEEEKKQIIDAYEQGEDDGYYSPEHGYDREYKDSETYYETFKKK